MKKVLLSMLMIFSVALFGTQFFAEETAETGDLVIHYQNTTGDYGNIGINTWSLEDNRYGGGMTSTILAEVGLTKADEFGIYWEFENLAVGEGDFGFQVVGDKDDGSGLDYDAKKYTNHQIQRSDLVAGKTVHVYMFPGSNTRPFGPEEEGLETPIPYLVTKPNLHNILLSFYDQADAYPENLGLHRWDFASHPEVVEWGTPDKAFVDVGLDNAGTPIKGVMLTYAEGKNPGAIIYDGSDKKTGNIEVHKLTDTVAGIGKADVIQVVDIGTHEAVENVYLNNGEAYIKEAYKFEFITMYEDDSGVLSGTFAPVPNQIMVEFNAGVKKPTVKEVLEDEELVEVELTDDEIRDIVKSWFTVTTGTEELEIETIDFNIGAASINSFVIILKKDLDNKKEYTLKAFIDEDRNIETEVAMDKEAPVFNFTTPNDFNGKDADKRIVEVAWNKPFDQNAFPKFIINDDRDGEVTTLFYVPKGDFSTIDTNVEGDYKILLRVSDRWGNIAEETFIFRVTKKVK